MKRTIRNGAIMLIPLALLAMVGPMFLLTTVKAQDDKPQPGDKVVFVIPANSAINTSVDKVLYIGRSPGGVVAGDCSADDTPRPLQQAVVVDPDGGGASRLGDLLTISVNGSPRTIQIPNGTRLKGLVRLPDCSIPLGPTVAPYARYEGTVD